MPARSALRRSAWLAILAVLLSAFAPLVSVARGAQLVDICTTAIGRVTVIDTLGVMTGTETPDFGMTGSSPCPYCLPHGAFFALPPNVSLGVPVVGGPCAVAGNVEFLHPARLPWAAHQPRAPPSR